MSTTYTPNICKGWVCKMPSKCHADPRVSIRVSISSMRRNLKGVQSMLLAGDEAAWLAPLKHQTIMYIFNDSSLAELLVSALQYNEHLHFQATHAPP